MVHFFVGTQAELIKMAPVMLEFQRRGMPFRYIESGQHVRAMREVRATFGVREPDRVIGARATDVATVRDGLAWMAGMGLRCLSRRSRVLREIFGGEGGICLIHGDTATTLLGCLLARRAGLRVAHVEAGLRSHSLLNPFPEEIVRIICMRLAHYLFCPSEIAEQNLAKMRVRGKVIRLPGNTVLDSLRLAEAAGGGEGRRGPYALATCHRLETISSKRRLSRVLEMLRLASQAVPLLFVQHEPTRKAMARWGLDGLAAGDRIETLPPQDYFGFVRLVRGAEFVLTDGGSIQEECYYLGRPCFLMRRRTERPEGVGENVVIGGYDRGRLEAFLAAYPRMCRALGRPASPSAIIADVLAKDEGGD